MPPVHSGWAELWRAPAQVELLKLSLAPTFPWGSQTPTPGAPGRVGMLEVVGSHSTSHASCWMEGGPRGL